MFSFEELIQRSIDLEKRVEKLEKKLPGNDEVEGYPETQEDDE